MASAIHSAVLSQIAQHPVTPGVAAMASVATIDGMMRRSATSDMSAIPGALAKAAGR